MFARHSRRFASQTELPGVLKGLHFGAHARQDRVETSKLLSHRQSYLPSRVRMPTGILFSRARDVRGSSLIGCSDKNMLFQSVRILKRGESLRGKSDTELLIILRIFTEVIYCRFGICPFS